NKSICEISLLLNISQSTVSGIITKWKQLGTTATQPLSGRPCKMTERGQRKLKCAEVRRSCQLSILKHLQNVVFRLASWNGFPWPNSCLQALHHQVQCKASDAVAVMPPLDF
ncbi:unnamed protein product, partial [Staurois parvus]